MIYNFTNEIECQQATEKLKWLQSKQKRVEIKEIRRKRTIPHNSYLHLILSYWALEYGETLEFTKRKVFKKWVNKDVFKTVRTNPKNGKTREEWRSTADLNDKELSQAIERFKNWSVSQTGIRLPEANEDQFLDHAQNLINQNKQWL